MQISDLNNEMEKFKSSHIIAIRRVLEVKFTSEKMSEV